MKKRVSMLLAFLLLAVSLTGCSKTPKTESSSQTETVSSESSASAPVSQASSAGEKLQSGELVLYTWENMFPREVLQGFTEETGVEVTYANFDYDETMLTKLENAKGGDYDVVIADDYIIETVIQEGLAQKLDPARISHYGGINPLYQGQFFDPDDAYTVPYGSGVQTIVYDPSLVEKEITGYADLWDPSLEDSVGIIANYRVINGMALKVLGESYNTEDTAAIEKAGEKLKELAPNIRLINDMNLQDDLISGEISAAVMYTSQVTMAKLANPDLEVVFPKEGIGFGIQGMFIPSAAPHADAAYAFIDYILRPEVSAKCYEYLGYYCTNQDADSLISEEYRDFLTLPADFEKDQMEMIQNISGEALEAHEKIWTEFKAACE